MFVVHLSVNDVILPLCQDKGFVHVRQMTGISTSIHSLHRTAWRKSGENIIQWHCVQERYARRIWTLVQEMVQHV